MQLSYAASWTLSILYLWIDVNIILFSCIICKVCKAILAMTMMILKNVLILTKLYYDTWEVATDMKLKNKASLHFEF
jgi:hypothetical protein